MKFQRRYGRQHSLHSLLHCEKTYVASFVGSTSMEGSACCLATGLIYGRSAARAAAPGVAGMLGVLCGVGVVLCPSSCGVTARSRKKEEKNLTAGVYPTGILRTEAAPISYHVPGTGTYAYKKNIRRLFVLMSFRYVLYYTYEHLYLYWSL